VAAATEAAAAVAAAAVAVVALAAFVAVCEVTASWMCLGMLLCEAGEDTPCWEDSKSSEAEIAHWRLVVI